MSNSISSGMGNLSTFFIPNCPFTFIYLFFCNIIMAGEPQKLHTVYVVHLAVILIWWFGKFCKNRQIKVTAKP